MKTTLPPEIWELIFKYEQELYREEHVEKYAAVLQEIEEGGHEREYKHLFFSEEIMHDMRTVPARRNGFPPSNPFFKKTNYSRPTSHWHWFNSETASYYFRNNPKELRYTFILSSFPGGGRCVYDVIRNREYTYRNLYPTKFPVNS